MINNNILLDICNISIEAGLITNKYYKQKNKIINKEDNSPLTRADIDSNDFIIKSLSIDFSNATASSILKSSNLSALLFNIFLLSPKKNGPRPIFEISTM